MSASFNVVITENDLPQIPWANLLQQYAAGPNPVVLQGSDEGHPVGKLVSVREENGIIIGEVEVADEMARELLEGGAAAVGVSVLVHWFGVYPQGPTEVEDPRPESPPVEPEGEPAE